MQTLTIFRKFKDGEIIALFPEEDWNHYGGCSSYMHMGQHSGADYNHVLAISKSAKLEEYRDLKTELESRGYNLKIRRKWVRSRSNTCI